MPWPAGSRLRTAVSLATAWSREVSILEALRIGDITTLSPTPSIVFVEQGVNDSILGLDSINSSYLTQFKVAYQTYLYRTRIALPNALIFCSIPTYRNDQYDASIPAYCDAVSSVVAAMNDPKIVCDWTMNLTYDPRPGNLWIHPDAAACLAISAKLAPQVYNCAMSHGLIPLYMPYTTTAAQLAHAYWYEPGTSTDPYVIALQNAIWNDPGSAPLSGAYAAIQKCVFYPPGTPGLGLTLDQQQFQLALWSAPGASTNPVVQGYQQILRELP